ncbi:hypothetical protein LTR62_004767 [Meristemomyces frigidus]|uniref:peptidylprolyl isomerase n=1 Tax=Meristemomyces frigidus TaxID=1508187 RepID=A0AAN7TG09_9PEZI|nr:hypothetical protein LTR62_004767 [Meristemomyces frigidus]
MANPSRPRVFLDIDIAEQPAGRLTIELFADKAPKTCENFRQLCTGEHDGMSYEGVALHRVIDEFMIQGGDIAKGDGTGTASIYDGGEFEDENLDWREMDAAALVCSANRGPHTNGSQFFITLEPCPHLNGKHTIFGRLVAGQQVVDRVAKVEVDKDDRPLEPVLIARCGELERRKKRVEQKPEAVLEHAAADTAHDGRGRRRKSDQSDDDMADTPEPPKRKARRQSDQQIDEGLRGRPRARSGSRSESQALSTTGEEDNEDRHSPATKHKRKRSKSPSGHRDSNGKDDREYERRRRSLPNQYGDVRYTRNYDREENRYRPSPRHGDDEYAVQRRDDRYRPSRGRHQYQDTDGRLGDGGRLGGDGAHEDQEPAVKFKGRGVMKYREPGRL